MMNGNAAIDLSKIQTVHQKDYLPANNNKRVIAFFLDSLFVTAAQTVAFAPFHFQTVLHKSVCQGIFWVFAAFAYWSFTAYKWGGTPGKLLLGLRVVGVDSQTNLSLGQLFLRETIGRILSLLPLCLGYLWVSWDKERRTFHDMIAKTRVIDFKK
jgi:uncharacterized RDD family membrane protein YckC